MNDRVALGTYQAVAGHGLRVPDDVSVVSFDDSDLAEWLTPRLTSVALPYRAMGVAAVELLLRAPAQPTEHRVDMPLSRRDSLAPPGSWSMRRGVQ
jgi:LacI family transcriptional regulator